MDNTDLVQLLRGNEGTIPYLYLDSADKVTVGVGHMIPSVDAAQTLRFVDRVTGHSLHPTEIAADYLTIKSRPGGMLYTAYRPFTRSMLPDEEVDRVLAQDLDAFTVQLCRLFPALHDYPRPAQLGIYDMAFNLGTRKLRESFPGFVNAVLQKDWNAASEHSHRRGPGERRNERTRVLFLEAASLVSA